jgi:hypothetical protein
MPPKDTDEKPETQTPNPSDQATPQTDQSSTGNPESTTETTTANATEASDSAPAEADEPSPNKLSEVEKHRLNLVWTGYISEAAENHPDWTEADFEEDRKNWHLRNIPGGNDVLFDFPFDPANPPKVGDPNAE